MGWCRKFIFFMNNEKEIWSRPHQWLIVAQGSAFIAGLLICISRVLVPITELPWSQLDTWGQRTQPEVEITSLRCVDDGSGCSPSAVSLCKPLLLCCHARWCRQCTFGGKLSPKSSWQYLPPLQEEMGLIEQREEGAKSQEGSGVPRDACAGVDLMIPVPYP